MTYLEWINQLRSQVGDTKRRVHVDFTGDGSTTVFQMPDDTFPVYDDGSQTVKVGGTTKTETSDYNLDKVTGTLTFLVAPTNGQAVTIDSLAVYLLNADWLQVTNDVIRSLGDDFWKEFVDSTSFTTVANMLSMPLTISTTSGAPPVTVITGQPDCIAVYDFSYRTGATEDWRPAEEVTNWRYDRDNNTIYIGRVGVFTVAGQSVKIRGLKTYVLGTTVAEDIDVQDKYLTIVEYGCIARYWRWRYKSVVELVSKMSTEPSRTPLQELIMLSDRFDRLYEIEKGKLKPAKPARIIPPYKEGGGRP